MEETPQNPDEKEILVRTIDILSMEVLRLKRENEILKLDIQTHHKGNRFKSVGYNDHSVNLWRKGINYYRREGFRRTLSKIFLKLTGR